MNDLKEKAKDNDSDEWKEKYGKIKKEFDDYKSDIKNKEIESAKRSALETVAKEILSERGVEKALKLAVATNWDGYELDENNKLKDAKKIAKELSEEWKEYVVKEEEKGANTKTPPNGAGGGQSLRMDDIYKKDEHGRYVIQSAEERQNAIANMITEGDE